jgi:hypothetical protein
MRGRMHIGTAVSANGLATTATALPGVARAEVREGVLYLDYDPAQHRIADVCAALTQQFGDSWSRSTQPNVMRLRWDRWSDWLHRLAERVQANAAPAYPVGFRQRLHGAYLDRYQHRRHGLRGERRGDWRHYLDAFGGDDPTRGSSGPSELPLDAAGGGSLGGTARPAHGTDFKHTQASMSADHRTMDAPPTGGPTADAPDHG